MTKFVLILTTVPADSLGEEIAQALVADRLAACVNVGAPMTSVYRWQGQIERESERQLVIKTTADRVKAVRERLRELHSYELPEFLVIEVSGGSEQYLEWVLSATSAPEPP